MSSDMFSMGTKILVEKLQESIVDREHPIDTVFLNLGTLVRNCSSNERVKEAIELDKRRGIETDNPSKVLLEEAKAEMINFIQFICQAFNNAPLAHNPKLVSYHANYQKCISGNVYKEPVHSKRVITLADEMVRAKLIYGKRKESKEGKVDLVEIPMNSDMYPWKILLDELRYTKNQHYVGMISNHPTDFHIGAYCRSFRLFRSYTGEVVWYKNLGNVVFDIKDTVPFNIYTHAILGDKEDIKSSVTGGAKKSLYEIASNEEWVLKTQEYIRERLYKLNVKIPINL